MRELEDRWILEFRDLKVVGASVERGVFLIELTNGATVRSDAKVRIADATESGLANAVALPVGDPGILIGMEVASAVAFKDGVLRMVFRPGLHLVSSAEGNAMVVVRLPGEFEWIGRRGVGSMIQASSE